MLGDLTAQDGDLALKRRLKFYTSPKLLVIDEVGYLSYSNRYADLLFEIISRRYHQKSSTIVTTNKPFAEWRDIFPNATCVVSLVDRLVHRSEIINIDGDSYRLKEAMEASANRKASREKGKATKPAKPEGQQP
jgi:DNA replication protein DnaC